MGCCCWLYYKTFWGITPDGVCLLIFAVGTLLHYSLLLHMVSKIGLAMPADLSSGHGPGERKTTELNKARFSTVNKGYLIKVSFINWREIYKLRDDVRMLIIVALARCPGSGLTPQARR
jgi:hypothetical protein